MTSMVTITKVSSGVVEQIVDHSRKVGARSVLIARHRAGSATGQRSLRFLSRVPLSRRSRVSESSAVSQFSQSFEGIDSGVVSIAPVDLDRITSDRFDPDRRNIDRHTLGGEQRFAAPLVHAIRTATGQSERAYVEEALDPIGPENREGAGVPLFDFARDVGAARGRVRTGVGIHATMIGAPENRGGLGRQGDLCVERCQVVVRPLRRYEPARVSDHD